MFQSLPDLSSGSGIFQDLNVVKANDNLYKHYDKKKMLNLTVLLNSKFARQFSSETILLSTLVDNHNELSLRSIGTLRPLNMSPVSEIST